MVSSTCRALRGGRSRVTAPLSPRAPGMLCAGRGSGPASPFHPRDPPVLPSRRPSPLTQPMFPPGPSGLPHSHPVPTTSPPRSFQFPYLCSNPQSCLPPQSPYPPSFGPCVPILSLNKPPTPFQPLCPPLCPSLCHSPHPVPHSPSVLFQPLCPAVPVPVCPHMSPYLTACPTCRNLGAQSCLSPATTMSSLSPCPH